MTQSLPIQYRHVSFDPPGVQIHYKAISLLTALLRQPEVDKFFWLMLRPAYAINSCNNSALSRVVDAGSRSPDRVSLACVRLRYVRSICLRGFPIEPVRVFVMQFSKFWRYYQANLNSRPLVSNILRSMSTSKLVK
jgi:hypothetical protein